MHETGRAGGDAGAGRAASSGRRWAGTGDPRADAGLPVRGGRHRDAQPGDRGTDRRRPPDRRGGPPLWAHCDLRVDASRPGPPGRFGRPGPPPPRPATVSGDSDSMSVLPVGVRASCTGAGPTRARSSLITERATFSWSAMACWVHPDPAHTWAWATWRPVSLGGRPRRWRTRAAEPPWRARPRSIDT